MKLYWLLRSAIAHFGTAISTRARAHTHTHTLSVAGPPPLAPMPLASSYTRVCLGSQPGLDEVWLLPLCTGDCTPHEVVCTHVPGIGAGCVHHLPGAGGERGGRGRARRRAQGPGDDSATTVRTLPWTRRAKPLGQRAAVGGPPPQWAGTEQHHIEVGTLIKTGY